MTLLITVAGNGFALSCSDMRISVRSGRKFIPVDENFNKHIIFHSAGLTANISYTGVAQWRKNGKKIRLYDVISESLEQSAKDDLPLAPLTINLIDSISVSLGGLKNVSLELHLIGYHKEVPYPTICVISTFRVNAPWSRNENLQWEYKFPDFNIFVKVAESPDVFFGGMDNFLRQEEKDKIYKAVINGADAFNVANLARKYNSAASFRSSAIGEKSVSVLIPQNGFVDTNLWDKTANGLMAFLPKMVFKNGTSWGPSSFPVSLELMSDGHLPKQSLFFKSIVTKEYKKRIKRLIFRHKKGKAIPSIMGLIGIALFGSIVEGYTDFDLGH